VWVLEIIPSFALYRGLYEFSQYAFLAGYGVRQGHPLIRNDIFLSDLRVVLCTYNILFIIQFDAPAGHTSWPETLPCNAECSRPWVWQH
jgi:hypothetical protein